MVSCVCKHLYGRAVNVITATVLILSALLSFGLITRRFNSGFHTVDTTDTKQTNTYRKGSKKHNYNCNIQCVPLATEPGISLIILTPMKILQDYVRCVRNKKGCVYSACL